MLVLCQITQNGSTFDLIGISPARSSRDVDLIFLQLEVKTQNKAKRAIRVRINLIDGINLMMNILEGHTPSSQGPTLTT